jgi:hypothetical protein
MSLLGLGHYVTLHHAESTGSVPLHRADVAGVSPWPRHLRIWSRITSRIA